MRPFVFERLRRTRIIIDSRQYSSPTVVSYFPTIRIVRKPFGRTYYAIKRKSVLENAFPGASPHTIYHCELCAHNNQVRIFRDGPFDKSRSKVPTLSCVVDNFGRGLKPGKSVRFRIHRSGNRFPIWVLVLNTGIFLVFSFFDFGFGVLPFFFFDFSKPLFFFF